MGKRLRKVLRKNLTKAQARDFRQSEKYKDFMDYRGYRLKAR